MATLLSTGDSSPQGRSDTGSIVKAATGLIGGAAGAAGSAGEAASGLTKDGYRANTYGTTAGAAGGYNPNASNLNSAQNTLSHNLTNESNYAQGQQAVQANFGQAQQAAGLGMNGYAQQAQATGLLLGSAAMGNQPSAAAIQQQQGLQQAILAQHSLAASAQGQASNYGAAQNTANLQQSAINSAAAQRAQEMATAQQAYGQLRGGPVQHGARHPAEPDDDGAAAGAEPARLAAAEQHGGTRVCRSREPGADRPAQRASSSSSFWRTATGRRRASTSRSTRRTRIACSGSRTRASRTCTAAYPEQHKATASQQAEPPQTLRPAAAGPAPPMTTSSDLSRVDHPRPAARTRRAQ